MFVDEHPDSINNGWLIVDPNTPTPWGTIYRPATITAHAASPLRTATLKFIDGWSEPPLPQCSSSSMAPSPALLRWIGTSLGCSTIAPRLWETGNVRALRFRQLDRPFLVSISFLEQRFCGLGDRNGCATTVPFMAV